MKRSICVILILCLTFSLIGPLSASAEEEQARIITEECAIRMDGKKIDSRLTDNDESTYLKYPEGAVISVVSGEDIGGVYIKFDRTPPLWTLGAGTQTFSCGENGFLHEYKAIDEDGIRALTLTFEEETSFADLFILSKGETLPGWIQVWRPAEGVCDVMLLACHSDDDQLFFAGSVPDAVARGAEMQVCYFTNHWNKHHRPHELLNGLWTCGLTRYPVIGPFTDTKKAMNEEDGLKIFEDLGFTYDDMVKYQTELLRRFKPQIVLVHDIEGEYGHSAHRLDSHSLRDAALLAPDQSQYPESAEKYGVWDPLKIYIHLYPENTIDFEIDVPLERFGGKTAYQVSQDAFRCHISQFNSRYRDWLIGTEEKPVTKGSEFPLYSPRYYGLWESRVGPDEIRTDFYEHIVFYADMADPPVYTPTPVTLSPSPTDETPTPVTSSPSPTDETPTEPQPSPPDETQTPTPPDDPVDSSAAAVRAAVIVIASCIVSAVLCVIYFVIREIKKQ